jgi:hypothetical protein
MEEIVNWNREFCLRQYVYWSGYAREYRDNPKLGYSSESYRAAATMASRWLGRYDALAA